jgi:hypothetical protein
MTMVDGVEVKVGDWVGFKSDVEQSGRIAQIIRGGYLGDKLILENENGFSGGYIGGSNQTIEFAKDCWVD